MHSWLTTDKTGAVVSYTCLRELDIGEISRIGEASLRRGFLYTEETRSLILDALSRRASQVVGLTYVINVSGTGIGHRKLMPFIREGMTGPAHKAIPPSLTETFVVGMNSIARAIVNMAMRNLASIEQRQLLNVSSGTNAFRSQSFENRFVRENMPTDIGGLRIINGYIGDEETPPSPNDHDALYAFWCGGEKDESSLLAMKGSRSKHALQHSFSIRVRRGRGQSTVMALLGETSDGGGGGVFTDADHAAIAESEIEVLRVSAGYFPLSRRVPNKCVRARF